MPEALNAGQHGRSAVQFIAVEDVFHSLSSKKFRLFQSLRSNRFFSTATRNG